MYGDRILPQEASASSGVWTYDPRTGRLWWSAGAFQVHGLPPHAPQPELDRALDFYTEASRALIGQAFQGGIDNGLPWDLELEINGADGRVRRVRLIGEAVMCAGVVVEIAGSFLVLDGSEEPASAQASRFERTLSAEQAMSQAALGAISDGVIRLDAGGNIVYCNEAAAALTGRPVERLLGRPFAETLKLHGANASDGRSPVQMELVAADGALRVIEGRISAVHDSAGVLLGSVFVFRDLTHTHSLARQLEHQSNHDPLTGLPNRGRFEEELAARLVRVRSNGELHAVLYLDLDRFTLVNDTCGHQEADRLLQQVAQQIARRLRAGDVLARIGDDKFGVILSGCTAEAALHKAGALVEAVGQLRLRIGERAIQLTLSAGVTVIDAAAEDSRQLLIQADTACYVAKQLGGGRARLYRGSDAEVSRTRNDMEWVPRIEQALDEERLELYAQRIVPLDGGSAPCYELLLRLRQPDGSVVAPADFLPAAQRFGLMHKIERSVVRQALDKIERLRQQGAQNFGYLSVNLSGDSLSDDAFTSFLLQELERLRTPPERVRFEITETSALTQTEAARTFICNLHRLGYKILLDDFGTGFTSFGYLKSLGANGLKVDQSFTRNLAGDVINQTIVESICKIGSRLGLEIIAEGVEDEATLQALRSLGVRHAQGWLFHRPEPLERALQ